MENEDSYQPTSISFSEDKRKRDLLVPAIPYVYIYGPFDSPNGGHVDSALFRSVTFSMGLMGPNLKSPGLYFQRLCLLYFREV